MKANADSGELPRSVDVRVSRGDRSPVDGALPGSSGTIVAFWDTETNGLLDNLTKLLCVGVETTPPGRYVDGADTKEPGYAPVTAALDELAQADLRVAHNGLDFDERAVRKTHPKWKPKEGSRPIDTLILSRLLFANIQKTGPNTHKCEPMLRSRHSVKAWGQRLGEHKIEYEPPNGWDGAEWEPAMSAYMGGDIKTLKRIFTYLMSRKPSPMAVTIEHDFAKIMGRQERWGFTFDMPRAQKLAADLHKMEQEMEAKLVSHFGEWWAPSAEVKIPKTRRVNMIGFPDVTVRRLNAKGKELKPYVGPPKIEYEEGATYTPVERKVFNPKSRDDVKFKLFTLYGWKPTKFNKPTFDKKTKRMKPATPKIDDEVLRQLPWKEAQILADYYVVVKILGYLSAGKNAWLALAREDQPGLFKIHGRINTIGTYTHRPTMNSPNMGQVPSVTKNDKKEILFGLDGAFGADCRALFTATPGFKLCGTDASGIQLRLFGHYLARYDDGEYANIVANEDPHAWLRDTVGEDIMGRGDEGRGHGKTVGYARLLGGGDLRLGQIVAPLEKAPEQKKVGKLIRDRLAERFKAEVMLKEAVTEAVNQRGYIISLDGRRVDVLKAHTGLATLLQSGEVCVMKKAIAIADDRYRNELGWRCGVDEAGRVRPLEEVDYEFVANVYDEFQADVRPHLTERYQEVACQSITDAGIFLKVKCPLKGDPHTGDNWMETH